MRFLRGQHFEKGTFWGESTSGEHFFGRRALFGRRVLQGEHLSEGEALWRGHLSKGNVNTNRGEHIFRGRAHFWDQRTLERALFGGRAFWGEHFYRGEHFFGEHFGENTFLESTFFTCRTAFFFDGRAPDATLASNIQFSANLLFGFFSFFYLYIAGSF